MLDSPIKALTRLRYSQRLLVFGGGILTTAMTLLMFVLESQSTLNEYAGVQRQAFFVDHARVMAEVEARAHAFRTALVSAALIWSESPPPDRSYGALYRAQGQSLLIRAVAGRPAQWISGATAAGLDERALLRFVGLSIQLGRVAAIEGLVRKNEFSGYFYTFSHDMVGIIPAPRARDRAYYSANREQLLALITQGVDAHLRSPDSHEPMAVPALTWIPPAVNPLTGVRAFKIAAPIMDDGRPFGVLVMEYDPKALLKPLAREPGQGAYLISTRQGGVVAQEGGRELPPSWRLGDIAGRTGAGWLEEYRSGVFAISKPLGNTGWVLVAAHPWREVLADIGWRVGQDGALALLAIALVWALLLRFKLRIVRPLVERSQRVFESEELSRTLIGTAPLGLGLIDVETGRSLLMSPEMALIGQRIGPGEPPLATMIVRRYKERVSRGDISWRLREFQEDVSLATVDGTSVDLSVSVVRVRYLGKDMLVAAFTDVTAKRRLEQGLREAKQASDQANAAKSAFLAAMSHEIRTPLNAILGNLELLAHSRLDAIQRDRLDTVQTSSRALLSIVSDVLDFSKIEAGEMRLEAIEFDALEVVSHALTMFEPVARAKGLSLLGEWGQAATWPTTGDPVRLGQVVQNLLSNAIKFTQAGQVLVRVDARADTSRLVISVEDTGIGMSRAQTDRLFRAFSQADASIGRRFGGTGLGLALCQGLTQAMAGTLTVQSEPGRGSRFTLALPMGCAVAPPDVPRFRGESVLVVAASDHWRNYLVRTLTAWGLHAQAYQHPAQVSQAVLGQARTLILWGERQTWHPDDENQLVEESAWVIDCSRDGPGEPVATGSVLSVSIHGLKGLAAALRHTLQGRALASRQRQAGPTARRLRVLVAEDNAANRALLREQLRLLDCDAELAEDGERALEALRRQRFDVLLTDLSMPGMDGYELAARVRQRWPSMPVVAVTANVTPTERERAKAAGMADVLSKPLLLAKLERALALLPEDAANADAVSEADAANGALLGKEAMPEDLMRVFAHACRRSILVLRQARLAQDTQGLRAELHQLKGMLGVFRRSDLSRALVEIETGMQQGTPSTLGRLAPFLDQLEQMLEQTLTPRQRAQFFSEGENSASAAL